MRLKAVLWWGRLDPFQYLLFLLFQIFSLGMIYTLQALGVTVVFGLMKLINFAHGEMYALGAYFTFFFANRVGLSPILSLLCSLLGMVLTGWIMNYLFIRPAYSGKVMSPEQFVIAATFGASLFIQNALGSIFGLYPASTAAIIPGVFQFGPISTSGGRLVALVGSVVTFLIVMMLIYRTRMGKAMRAVSQNSEAATICGVNSGRVYMFSFVLSVVLAGLAGSLVIPFLLISPGSGGAAIMITFVVVVLGGLGSVRGAIVGSLIIAVAQELTVSFIPDLRVATAYVDVWGLLILIIVLIVRPRGLFGEKVRAI